MLQIQTRNPRPPFISLRLRWMLLCSMCIICFSFLRYPFAIQNFLRADGLLALGLTKKAITQYDRAILLYPEFDRAYTMLAWAYELDNNNGKAKMVYERGIKNPHEDELIYLDYIVFLWKNRDNGRAVEVAEDAYNHFPQSQNVLRVYANSLEKNDARQAAQKIWRRYLELFPDDTVIKEKVH